MKLFPSLALVTLCAAFAGCTATTQTISFVPGDTEQSGVIVSLDGQKLGEAPVDYTATRTETPAVHKVVFSKDGYVSEDLLVESWLDEDGLCSYLNDYPVPALQPDKNAVKKVAVVATPPAKEVAPEPAPEPVKEVVSAKPAEAKPVEVKKPAEAKPVVVAPIEKKPEVVVAPTAEIPAEPAEGSESDLEKIRTLKDIQKELKTLSEQRQNGRLSEQEFQKACADLEREVRTRYGK